MQRYTNRPCDKCDRIDLDVYPKYEVTTGTCIPMERDLFGRVVPATSHLKHLCIECLRSDKS